MSLTRPAIACALVALAALGTPRASLAQYDQPAALRRPVAASAAAAPTVLPDSGEHHRSGKPVLVGAAIGAGVGIVAMAIAASGPGVTDHSEDALGYIAFGTFGALIGMTVGLIVAVSRD